MMLVKWLATDLSEDEVVSHGSVAHMVDCLGVELLRWFEKLLPPLTAGSTAVTDVPAAGADPGLTRSHDLEDILTHPS